MNNQKSYNISSIEDFFIHDPECSMCFNGNYKRVKFANMISKLFKNVSIDEICELLDIYSFDDVYEKCKKISDTQT